jgi:hypothetical protein
LDGGRNRSPSTNRHMDEKGRTVSLVWLPRHAVGHSARGLAHSTTLARSPDAPIFAKRPGVRRSSAAVLSRNLTIFNARASTPGDGFCRCEEPNRFGRTEPVVRSLLVQEICRPFMKHHPKSHGAYN